MGHSMVRSSEIENTRTQKRLSRHKESETRSPPRLVTWSLKGVQSLVFEEVLAELWAARKGIVPIWFRGRVRDPTARIYCLKVEIHEQ